MPDELLEIEVVLAEGSLRLALCGVHGVGELLLAFYRPHAAPATAPTGLEHDRIVDLAGQALYFFVVIRKRIGRRHYRYANRHGEISRRNLVAERPHRLGLGPDKQDAARRTRLREFRPLRQEAIARMDRIDFRR